MAIHIDIYAHLKKNQLIKEGDQLKRYIDSLEGDVNKRLERGAQGRTAKLVKLNDAQAASYDRLINASDDYTKATKAEKQVRKEISAIKRRDVSTDERAAKVAEALAKAEKELATVQEWRARAAQNLSKATNDQTRAVADLKTETTAHSKQLRQVNTLVGKNKREFTDLTRATSKARRELENLHSTSAASIRDHAGLAKQMDKVGAATKKTTDERAKYNEMVKEGTATYKQLRAQSEKVRAAHENERRVIASTSDSLGELLRTRRQHDVVVDANSAALRRNAREALDAQRGIEDLRNVHALAIRDNAALSRSFSSVGTATDKAFREHQKYNIMARDGSVSQSDLRRQLDRTTDAYAAQRRQIRSATDELERHRRKALEDERSRFDNFSPGRYLAKNLGALTPLGTVSPSTLMPLLGLLGSVAEAAVTASQSLALLPAAAAAGGAGITTLMIGLNGFGDALKYMNDKDPKKFAEALFQLSPAAQQAALSIQQLTRGPLGDLAKATQEAMFADIPATMRDLAATFGPTLQKMTTSIATSFNHMFRGTAMQLMSPDMQARIEDITNNLIGMFQHLEPAIAPFVDAFVRLTQVGASFLPGLADSIARVAVTFDNFIARTQASGQLQEFIQKGIDAVKALGSFLLDLGQDIYEVFGNKSPEEFIGTLNSMKDFLIGIGQAIGGIASVMNEVMPFFTGLANALGGWDNLFKTFLGGWIAFKALGVAKLLTDAAGAMGALKTSAAVAGAESASAFAAAGAGAGAGFAGKIATAVRGFGWAAVAATIAIPLFDALDRKVQDWINSSPLTRNDPQTQQRQRDRLIPNTVPILPFWEDRIRDLLDGGSGGGTGGSPQPNVAQQWLDRNYPNLNGPLGAGNADAGLTPPTPATPWANLPLPNVPLDENGKALTDQEILNKYRGELPRDQYAVDAFTDPITGQKLNPMLPIGPNGMPQYPAGGVPGTPSIQGPVMPHYNSFGQFQGYGANMVDPEKVFDAQLAVTDKATELEEANKDLLAAKKAGILSEEEINDLDRKVMDKKIALHKALVQLGDAQTGDYEKLNTKAKGISDMLGDVGAGLDKDFGISKGLGGIVENFTKMLGNLAFAPAFGAMRGAQAALGFPKAEGAGSGLFGIGASLLGWHGQPTLPDGTPVANSDGTPNGASGAVSNATAAAGVPSYLQYLQSLQGGVQGNGRYTSDAALINSIVPMRGNRYVSQAGVGDLTQGIGDCTSSIEDLINTIDGKGTAGRSMATGNAAQWLSDRGFLPNPTGANIPGAFNVGWNDHHMQATLPGGTNWNWGGDASAQARGMSGGGAFDPSQGFTSHYYRLEPVAGPNPGGNPALAGPPFAGGAAPATTPGMLNPAAQPGPSAPTIPPFNITDPGLSPPPRFASGGEVPIVAHAGEHVLTRADVSAMGGQSGVYNFRQALHYDNGGAVGSGDPGLTNPTPAAPRQYGPFIGEGNKPGVTGIPADITGIKGTTPEIAKTEKALADRFGPQAPAPAPPGSPNGAPFLPPAPAPTPGGVPNPAGVPTEGSHVGSQVEPYAGYGPGFKISGGVIGAALGAAGSAASAAASGASMGADGGSGGAAASAAIQIAIQELTRGIEFGAQAAGIGAQGVIDTFLPAGGSKLAQENWLTRWLGGIVGATPAIANLAGGGGPLGKGANLPGVGPSTPEQIAAQGMDPNRTEHTGTGYAPGPYTGVNIEQYNVAASEDRAGQDIVRYIPGPGAR